MDGATTWITIAAVLHGNDRSPYLLVGRYGGTHVGASIMWTTTHGQQHGSGPIQRGFSTISSGKESEPMLYNKATSASYTLKLVFYSNYSSHYFYIIENI